MTCVERLIGRAVALVPVSAIRAPFLARLSRKIAGEAGHGGSFCVRRRAPALLSAGMTAGSGAVPVGLSTGSRRTAAMGSQPRNHGNPDPRAAAASAPAPSVEFSPRSGATDVAPDQPVALAADHARLTSATLRAADGTPVAGTAGADGRSWRAGTPLRYGTTYTWTGQVAERAMTVQTSIPTPGSWAWLDDDNGGSRAHWRPQNYWTSGTQVAVTVSGPRCRR